MKICMVSSDYLPNIGGIASHIYELSKELLRQGNEVWVVTNRSSSLQPKYSENEGIKTHRVSYINIKNTLNFQIALKTSLLLERIVRKNKIDVVHWHTLSPSSLTTKLVYNCSKIFTNHSSTYLMMYKQKKFKLWLRFQMSHANRIIAPSKELFYATKEISPNKEVVYIPNGVDTLKFCPNNEAAQIRKKYAISDYEIVILCPRRLDAKNGVIYLAEALPIITREYRNIKVLFVGEGSEQEKITRELENNGSEKYVVFAGRIANSEMPAYFSAADIVAIPSLIEATSIAGLEAMATGKPVIASNIGGLPEIVEDGITGLLVPPKDPKRLGRGILELIRFKLKREDMGIAGRRVAIEKFSWKNIAQKTLMVYQSSLKS